jgi:amino-acid N-acetyltransferase
MTAPIQAVSFDERIATLLEEGGLPTADLAAGSAVLLFSYVRDNEHCAVVGLELHGYCGLLRSLAVTPRCRGEGIGGALLAHAERAAVMHGVKELYLLTTTAEQYFSGRGYEVVDRATAPAAITRTRQFSDLCPSSSVLMVKGDQAKAAARSTTRRSAPPGSSDV